MLLAITILAGCQSKAISGQTVTAAGGSYQNITPTELHAMLKNKDFVFINVHIPFAGNIADTDLSIPYDQIEQDPSQLPSNKDTKIALHCRSGHMSQIAAEKLVSFGYTNIWNLDGGMVDWENAGYEIEK
jgi:phage shock protein E